MLPRAQPQNGDTDANECSFAEINRKSKRGGNWVSAVADLPSPSLYVRCLRRLTWLYHHPDTVAR